MAKFNGAIGFGHPQKQSGVTKDVITEVTYSGDLIRPSRQTVQGEKVNDDFSVQTQVSVLADGNLTENLLAIRYVKWMGVRWKVVEVTPEYPRLILRLGGVWDGPEPAAAP